jgi:hypothetical protein
MTMQGKGNQLELQLVVRVRYIARVDEFIQGNIRKTGPKGFYATS